MTSDTPHAYRPRPTGKRSWIEWKFITPTSGGPRTTSATACGTWIQSRDGTAGHAVALRKGTAWVASQGSARELGGTSPRYRDPPRSSRHEKKDGINRVHHATPLNPAPFIPFHTLPSYCACGSDLGVHFISADDRRCRLEIRRLRFGAPVFACARKCMCGRGCGCVRAAQRGNAWLSVVHLYSTGSTYLSVTWIILLFSDSSTQRFHRSSAGNLLFASGTFTNPPPARHRRQQPRFLRLSCSRLS